MDGWVDGFIDERMKLMDGWVCERVGRCLWWSPNLYVVLQYLLSATLY